MTALSPQLSNAFKRTEGDGNLWNYYRKSWNWQKSVFLISIFVLSTQFISPVQKLLRLGSGIA